MKGHNRAFLSGDLTAAGVALLGVASILFGRLIARGGK